MSSTTLGQMLASLAEPSFGIPTDVTFQIMHFYSSEVVDGQEKDELVLGEVKGHKLVLGLFSSVFKQEFFGPAKETKDIIPVRQSTLEAFQKMFDYIYQKNIEWSELTLSELYDIVNLAEKYDITGLMEEVSKQMENLPMTMEDVMEIADTAAQFTQFPTVSSILLLTCAKFLKTTLTTPSELLEFATNQSGRGQGDTVLQLLALIRGLQDLPKCTNCRGEECQNGKLLDNSDQFLPGVKLAVNKENADLGVNGGVYADKVYTVISMENCNTIVKLKCQHGGDQRFFIVGPSSRLPTLYYNCV